MHSIMLLKAAGPLQTECLPGQPFKKMLNKELSQVYDGDKISSQISEYICSTFLDQDEQTTDNQLPGISGNGGGGANEEGGNEGAAASSALVAAVAAAASAAAAAAASKATDTVKSGGVGVVDVGVGITEQKTITAGSSTDFRKMQHEGQQGPSMGSSVIVRLDRSTAQKLAAAAAASETVHGCKALRSHQDCGLGPPDRIIIIITTIVIIIVAATITATATAIVIIITD
ncbi:unnamed protein product [Hydatigera taeniaeformis]|uniref:3',5'-cyclic-AMP phosphodiesterase n=1 Tax=Hydatigena taeniaeformis TaxID=6205 RepID=A0A0R3WJJ0_HYDTA|nr:unnamed protein product [Hydatigera taeniaeformis]